MRSTMLERLEASSAPIVAVVAPGGYGKIPLGGAGPIVAYRREVADQVEPAVTLADQNERDDQAFADAVRDGRLTTVADV